MSGYWSHPIYFRVPNRTRQPIRQGRLVFTVHQYPIGELNQACVVSRGHYTQIRVEHDGKVFVGCHQDLTRSGVRPQMLNRSADRAKVIMGNLVNIFAY